MQPIFAHQSATISGLKRNPTALIEQADGEPIVILNHNVPSAYLVPSATFERMMEQLDDLQLNEICNQRMQDRDKAIEVTLEQLLNNEIYIQTDKRIIE